MDTEALRTFVMIDQAKGFSRAAELLGRSQPAISRRIALLEAELGVPLFERVAGGVALSEAGRALLPHARRVLAAVRDAGGAIAAMRSATGGPVSIAAVGTLAGANLTLVLKRFVAEHPGVDLSIRTATSAEISELVREGEASIGLRYLSDPAPDLLCEQIASETVRIVCAPEHRFAGRTLSALGLLRDEHWFAFPQANRPRESFADNIHAQFEARGIGAIRSSPIDSLNAMKRLVEAGMGIALLPETAMLDERRSGTLAQITVRDLRGRHPVFAVLRRDGYLSPAAAHLLGILRDTSDLAGALSRPRRARRR